MTANDKYGKLIEVGDIVVYTANTKGGGGLTIGIVDRMTNKTFSIRSRGTRDEWACDIGAPDIIKTGTRPKVVDGQFVREYEEPNQWGQRRRNLVYEDYEWTTKDYTLTGRRKHFWQTTVIRTSSNIIILRKA